MKSYLLRASYFAFLLSITPIDHLNAAVVYHYIGNNYTNFWTSPSLFDTSMNISGSFTVDSKLISTNGDISNQVKSYQFTDGKMYTQMQILRVRHSLL